MVYWKTSRLKNSKKVNKFGNIHTKCPHNHTHPSKSEAAHCIKLHLWLKSKDCPFTSIEYEPLYKIEVNARLICIHKPDFLLTYKSGELVIHEVKGKPTPDWKLKRKLFMALYPHIAYLTIGGPMGCKDWAGYKGKDCKDMGQGLEKC